MPRLGFFSDNRLEQIENPDTDGKIIARNALKVLTMGWQEGVWHHFMYWRVFKAIFVKRDKALMRDLRAVFQNGFDHLLQELQRIHPNETSDEIEMHLSACLCLLSIADLRPDEWIRIPQWIDNSWKAIRYRVTPIELTPTTGLESLFLSDVDRAFCYALQPFNGSAESAVSHLIYPSTTYPAGRGFLSHIRADLEAFETSGASLYVHARQKIHDWIAEQKKEGLHVHGHSLGGSQALLTAQDSPHVNIKKVIAFNPEGLYKPVCFSSTIGSNHHEHSHMPEVTVMMNEGDPVSLFGEWPDNARLYNIIPPMTERGQNALCDHALIYTGLHGTKFELLNAQEENNAPDRQWRNFYLNTLLRGIVYYTFVLPYYYLVHPPLRFILNNKALSTTLAGGLFVCLTQLGYITAPALAPIVVGLLALGIVGLKLLTMLTTDVVVEMPETHLNDDANYPPLTGYNRDPHDSPADSLFALQF